MFNQSRIALLCAGLLFWAVTESRGQVCNLVWEPSIGQPGVVDPVPESDATVSALAVLNVGAGQSVYAGGEFPDAGGLPVNNIARWNGVTWSPLAGGTTIGTQVYTLAGYDDGGGLDLYIGGSFTTPASYIAHWQSGSWQAVGTGTNGSVLDLAIFDGKLFAGGTFSQAGGNSANRVAQWDGSNWSGLGIPFNGLNSTASSLVGTDATSAVGPALYVGGNFSTAGGQPASRIAKWNGVSWSALGSGINIGGRVLAMAVFDDGSGDALYAAGDIASAGGESVSNIARWDGSSWSDVGGGVDGIVHALTVFDDGSGPALYAGGDFSNAGSVPASRVAKWDGSSWFALGSGTNDDVRALAGADYDTMLGPRLYAGGDFTVAGGAGVGRIADWGCTPVPGDGDCVDDDVIDLDDHAVIADCVTGPAGGLESGCYCTDFDLDVDVDLLDWAEFQLLLPGS